MDVCKSLISCFMQTVDMGLRFGGGIGETLVVLDYDDPSFIGRWFFTMLFFICICVIFLNVIFGIIIDTFAELRDEQSIRGNLF